MYRSFCIILFMITGQLVCAADLGQIIFEDDFERTESQGLEVQRQPVSCDGHDQSHDDHLLSFCLMLLKESMLSRLRRSSYFCFWRGSMSDTTSS